VIEHRIGVFKSFLEHEVDGKIKSSIKGLTNTLRFKHAAPIANLPGVDKPWGKEIRSCIIAPPGFIICGADMVSLESMTKRHYMFPLDPDYVKEMSQPGFDEHLDLARHAGELTVEQVEAHKNGVEDHGKIRKAYKRTNYSAIYGVGAEKLAREMGIPVSQAKALLEAYWSRNWSVKKIAEQQFVKECLGSLWLKNPLSGLWYQLRYQKDRFSTLNQGTGVYVFDRWIYQYRKKGVKVALQYHDETANYVKAGGEENHRNLLENAIREVNESVRMNVELAVDVKFGNSYAEVH